MRAARITCAAPALARAGTRARSRARETDSRTGRHGAAHSHSDATAKRRPNSIAQCWSSTRRRDGSAAASRIACRRGKPHRPAEEQQAPTHPSAGIDILACAKKQVRAEMHTGRGPGTIGTSRILARTGRNQWHANSIQIQRPAKSNDCGRRGHSYKNNAGPAPRLRLSLLHRARWQHSGSGTRGVG